MVAGAGSRTSPEPGIRDTDERVLRALLDADERALRALIETYGRFVYGKALQILAEPSLAEEVAQDVFLALWLDPHRFDPERGSLKTFLVVVARHKAHRHRSARTGVPRQGGALILDVGPDRSLQRPPYRRSDAGTPTLRFRPSRGATSPRSLWSKTRVSPLLGQATRSRSSWTQSSTRLDRGPALTRSARMRCGSTLIRCARTPCGRHSLNELSIKAWRACSLSP